MERRGEGAAGHSEKWGGGGVVAEVGREGWREGSRVEGTWDSQGRVKAQKQGRGHWWRGFQNWGIENRVRSPLLDAAPLIQPVSVFPSISAEV